MPSMSEMSEEITDNNDANQQDDAPKSTYPDGFGMSIEEVRALLSKKHEIIVPIDDPILLMVTISNVFLEEQEKLNQKHLTAMNKLLTERTEIYINAVRETTAGLSKTLENITVDGIRDVQEKNALDLQNFKSNMWWATGIITLSAFLNIAAFILR